MGLTRTEAESNEKERWVLTNKRGVISMGYISVHGRYHHGKIELLEDLVPDEGSELIITVLSKESKSKDPELEQDPWRILKGQIVAQYPELKRESKQKAVTEFERLSEKIASNMRFKTLEELEKFMRREDYDLS